MKDIAISLVEHSSWPLVVLLCFLLLRRELLALVSRIKGFRAGAVEVQFGEQLRVQGFSKDQLKALGALSADDVDIFMLVSFSENVGFSYNTGLVPATFKLRLLRLQDAGLLQILNPEDPGTNLRHDQTLLGRRLRALLVNSSTQLLRDVA